MICLILGDTDFPKLILKNIIKKKIKYFIIDLSKENIFKNDKNSNKVSIGQFGKMIQLIKSYKCKKVLFAGKINKPNFSSLRMDIKGFYYLPKIIKASKLGDAAIIKIIIGILKKQQISVISSIFFNPELASPVGNYTILKPTMKDTQSIKNGLTYLNRLNTLDHIQAIIVKDNKIIMREGTQGTKKMLSKLKKKSGAILMKFPKRKQDLRIDLPTIGLDTLKDCKKYGLKGIVLKAKKNIFLDKAKCISFANENNIFIKII